jgi:hypothetical protein
MAVTAEPFHADDDFDIILDRIFGVLRSQIFHIIRIRSKKFFSKDTLTSFAFVVFQYTVTISIKAFGYLVVFLANVSIVVL